MNEFERDTAKAIKAFFSSGLFFMIVGCIMLYVAYATLSNTHSAFTFVIVVLGSAILLYGTGTQGIGAFATEQDRQKLNIQLAGGAGVLAFVIAFGVVRYEKEIRLAFGVQTQYVKLLIKPDDNGKLADISDYSSVVVINGSPVPSFVSRSAIVVYAPHSINGPSDNIDVDIRLQHPNYRCGETPADTTLLSCPGIRFETLTLNARIWDGMAEYPTHKDPLFIPVARPGGSVDTTSRDRAAAEDAAADAGSLEPFSIVPQ